jgi:hypothetical protein
MMIVNNLIPSSTLIRGYAARMNSGANRAQTHPGGFKDSLSGEEKPIFNGFGAFLPGVYDL